MDKSKSSPFLSPQEKDQVNFCRLYIQAETLADLCNIEGTEINENCFNSQNTHMGGVGKTLWTKQAKPGHDQWTIFKSFIRKTFCRTQHTNQLKVKLRRWNNNGHDRLWNCYYDNIDNEIACKNQEGTWDIYSVTPQETNTRQGNINYKIRTTEHNKEKGVPSFISTCGTTSWITHEHVLKEPPLLPREKTFKKYLKTIPEWERELLADCECVDSSGGKSLADYISNFDSSTGLVGASDRGLRKIKGEYGVHG